MSLPQPKPGDLVRDVFTGTTGRVVEVNPEFNYPVVVWFPSVPGDCGRRFDEVEVIEVSS